MSNETANNNANETTNETMKVRKGIAGPTEGTTADCLVACCKKILNEVEKHSIKEHVDKFEIEDMYAALEFMADFHIQTLLEYQAEQNPIAQMIIDVMRNG